MSFRHTDSSISDYTSSGTFDYESWRRDRRERRLRSLGENVDYKPYGRASDKEAAGTMTDKPAPPPEDKDILKVEKVDYLTTTNTVRHHTFDYDAKEEILIVRRGERFNINVTFNRKFDQTKDELRIVFETGDSPVVTKGTEVHIILSDKDEPGKWGATIYSQSGNDVNLSIFTPPTCFVGRWKFSVDVIKKSDKLIEIFNYDHGDKICILFNPWCEADSVYFPSKKVKGPDEEAIDEYVMNESGKIYAGNTKVMSVKPWNFGQFEEGILDCVLWLLEKHMPVLGRGNAVLVSRKLSALINACDEKGVLVGNWSGDYEGGKKPTSWQGSVKIFEEYYKTKTPVKYGQCWVFSGLLTTALRTLGIPARSVTNFASAHDSDGRITIDSHYNSDGDPLKEYNCDSVWWWMRPWATESCRVESALRDSVAHGSIHHLAQGFANNFITELGITNPENFKNFIRNFHVWNEAYMARPELPAGFGGWQACDATPQETSDGIYCCGPASLAAIRNGEVMYPYDAPFVFAEVNSDRIDWVISHACEPVKTNVRTHSIGKNISTKKIGKKMSRTTVCTVKFDDPDRDDVTSLYKHAEDSEAERTAVARANQTCSTRTGAYDCTEKDVKLTIADLDECVYGKPFAISVTVKNTSKEMRTITGKMSVASVFYTGVAAHLVKCESVNVTVDAGKEKLIKMNVSFEEYEPKIVQDCMLKTCVLCHVKETLEVFSDDDDFRLIKPDLTMKAPSEAERWKKIKIDVSFTNPLPIPLTECTLVFEGAGLWRPQEQTHGNVPANGKFSSSIEISPHRVGERNLFANFSSKELLGISGVCAIHVTK